MAGKTRQSRSEIDQNGSSSGKHLCRVTLKALPGALPEGERVYVTGNLAVLGNWDPGAVAMEPAAEGGWHYTFSVRRGSLLEFKFTRGDWDTEAVDDTGFSTGNCSLRVHFDTRLTVHIPTWKDLVPRPQHPIQGQVRYHRHMEGEGIPPRDVVVWLPPGYEADEGRRYPVIYAHDGQNLFDPATAYTGVDWRLDETAYRLIEEGKMEPVIIVGIYNTPRRLAEYSLSPKGELYRKFIVTRLKPFIDTTYRTRSEPAATVSLGSSMGGLVSFLLAWRNPHVFGRAICMSPSFIYRNSRVIRWLQRQNHAPEHIQLYLDCGLVGSEKLLLRGCRRVLRVLKKLGWQEGVQYFWHMDEYGNHSEASWGNRVWRPLLLFFGKNEALATEIKRNQQQEAARNA